MSRYRIAANAFIHCRYERTARRAARRFASTGNPFCRPATTRLTASRLMSHSHGPGKVSSKSLRSKTSFRSGVPKIPKLLRCASPPSCTRKPDWGVPARSRAMTLADPRRKANGESDIRPNRIGTSRGTRSRLDSSNSAIGSGRSRGGDHAAWLDRGTWRRRALPARVRSRRDSIRVSTVRRRFLPTMEGTSSRLHCTRLKGGIGPVPAGQETLSDPAVMVSLVPLLSVNGRPGRPIEHRPPARPE